MSQADKTSPSKTVFLHVGLPKSGTSYIQKALTANKRQLRRRGLLFPGKGWVDQVRAVRDVRGMGATRPGPRGNVQGSWRRLVKEISAWPTDAIISMEWLAAAGPEQIRTIVEDLQPARVEVIFTARDLARTVPAAWQEFMQNRQEWTWEEFLEGVVADDRTSTPAGRRFWAQQDLVRLLETWLDVVPREAVHVLTVPPPGAGQDVLWHRLCQVIGRAYRKSKLDGLGSNSSLGMESAELMRRLNRFAREEQLPQSVYLRAFKHDMAKAVLAGGSGAESKLLLPPDFHEWASREAARQVDWLEASGVHVVGDLQDLRPVPPAAGARQPADVPDGLLLDIALGTLVSMAGRWGPGRGEGDRLKAETAQLQARLDEIERRPFRSALRLQAQATRKRLTILRGPRRPAT